MSYKRNYARYKNKKIREKQREKQIIGASIELYKKYLNRYNTEKLNEKSYEERNYDFNYMIRNVIFKLIHNN